MSKSKNLKALCVCSVMAALYIALEYVAAVSGKAFFGDSYQLPLSCLPLIIASLIYGIPWGVATAVVGSFLSQIITYGIDWSTLLWMVPTVVYALSVALLYLIFRKSNNRILLGAEFFVSSLILSVSNIFVNFYFNYVQNLTNALLKIFIPFKIGIGLVFAVIFAVIVPPIIKKLDKFIK